MDELKAEVDSAQRRFASLLASAFERGPVTVDQYVRYLSMQYHLTKGVQRYFYTVASHPSLRRRLEFRKFLVDFANEEESHYLIAERDVKALGRDVLPEPLDVTLWHAYFQSVVTDRPFIRLGATAILENIANGPASAQVKQALAAPFLTRDNSRFVAIHQHETIPHGDQILDVLSRAGLSADEFTDLVTGARHAAVMYLRMARWAMEPHLDPASA
jgi:hypothetical protein